MASRRISSASRRKSSSAITIEPSQLSTLLLEQFNNYRADVAQVIRDSVTSTLDGGLKELRQAGAYKDRTGDYRRSFTTKIETAPNSVIGRLYADEGEYRLTHLLERGHRAPSGGRTAAFPHWAPTEKKMTEDFEKRLRDGIENLGGQN